MNQRACCKLNSIYSQNPWGAQKHIYIYIYDIGTLGLQSIPVLFAATQHGCEHSGSIRTSSSHPKSHSKDRAAERNSSLCRTKRSRWKICYNFECRKIAPKVYPRSSRGFPIACMPCHAWSRRRSYTLHLKWQ